MRKVTTDVLRANTVLTSASFIKGSLCGLDHQMRERLIIIVNWVHKQVELTVVQGIWFPPIFQDGTSEQFSVDYIFSRYNSGYHRTKSEYEDEILSTARAAQEMLDDDKEAGQASDDLKERVRALLQPFKQEYEM